MKFEKKSLYQYSMLYALGTFERQGQPCVVAATEDAGPILVSAPPYTEAEILVPGPGGCMSLASHPSLPGELYAIMGCFLGYQFHGGAVYRIADSGSLCEKIIDLPFAHRMQIFESQGRRTLFVANLAASKDNPTDWSRPGGVYSVPLNNPQQTQWPMTPILENLHKNHGIFLGPFDGKETLWVSGQEGLFSFDPSSQSLEASLTKELSYEVSEMALFDLDSDGEDELVTIEPFHGPVLSVYKRQKGRWKRIWEDQLSYGHCVLAQRFHGRPSILVSNRAGTKDLVLYQFDGSFPPHKITVDHGIGAANMLVQRHGDREFLFATAQATGELVRYVVAD